MNGVVSDKPAPAPLDEGERNLVTQLGARLIALRLQLADVDLAIAKAEETRAELRKGCLQLRTFIEQQANEMLAKRGLAGQPFQLDFEKGEWR